MGTSASFRFIGSHAIALRVAGGRLCSGGRLEGLAGLRSAFVGAGDEGGDAAGGDGCAEGG